MFVRALASLLLLLPLAANAQSTTAPFEPKEGVDYITLSTPQPTFGQGKIEIAEVFGYTCSHCANFQPKVDAWKKRLGADVRFVYVPAVFGGVWDNFARAYLAADAMGVAEKTHNDVFKAIHIERKIKTGSLEEIADLYGAWGVDRNTFLSTMNSFAINAKISRAKQFAQRTGVTGTPTLVVAGKYRVQTTVERGHDGVIVTADWLVARERAAAKAAAATKPATAAKAG